MLQYYHINFSLGHELLCYVLEMVDVPTLTKKTVIDEAMFRNIIDWCDVWIILFKTKGTLNFAVHLTVINRFYLFEIVPVSDWLTANFRLDNSLNHAQTCSRLAIIKWKEAMRTRPDINLAKSQQLLQAGRFFVVQAEVNPNHTVLRSTRDRDVVMGDTEYSVIDTTSSGIGIDY